MNTRLNSASSSAAGSNRRESTRVPLGMNADLYFDDGSTWNGRVLDVSTGGVLVAGLSMHEVGEVCEIAIHWEDAGLLEVRAMATIVRQADGYAALRFSALHGFDSLEHLEQLVLANAEATDLVEAEFAAHVGLRLRD